ncbi:MAG: STAS domain-containing protein [Chloroflexi bacterium]|nr:STAS domain-containing protein [Chloroflexota bacterium]
MDIEVTERKGKVPVTVIHVKGNVDASTYEAFQAAGENAFNSGSRYVLLDLAEVVYISSAGFRAISQIFKLLRGQLSPAMASRMSQGLRDGSFKAPNLKLLGPNNRMLEALKLAGFDTFLEIYTDIDAAVKSFEQITD